jgi:hypothetical protein
MTDDDTITFLLLFLSSLPPHHSISPFPAADRTSMIETPSMDVVDVLLPVMGSANTTAVVEPDAERKSRKAVVVPVTGARTRTKPSKWKVPSRKRT